MKRNWRSEQQRVCDQYGATWFEAPEDLKVGIARNVGTGLMPINGLRHPPEGDTTGWYIWAGEELSDASDFFEPLHVKHLEVRCPEIMRFLGLAPGWRFLVANKHEDVWEDRSLSEVSPFRPS